MDHLGITKPNFLEVELPQTLLESPSVSTFLPDEEASICPLLSNNSALGPGLLSHPLSPNILANDLTSSNISNTDCKAETSSSGSSTGIVMDALDDTSTNLFNKVNYHHLQNNNITTNQDSCLKGNRKRETPTFVSWNWPLIRKCTFFIFISGILAMCSIVVARIANMPKYCNSKTAWYRGSVFYEINPDNFKDSDHDGIGDIGGIINGVDYLAGLGISGVRLNSIFPHYDNASSINRIRPELGNLIAVRNLANNLHSRNMTLLMDFPIQHVIAGRNEGEVIDIVTESLLHWINLGVDGFYFKGLRSLIENGSLINCLASWKRLLGMNRVIIVEKYVLEDRSKESQIFDHIDLVDIVLNIDNNTFALETRIKTILAEMPLGDEAPWIHWSIGESKNRNNSDTNNNLHSSSAKKIFAATIMQLILPGTANIMHANKLAIAQSTEYENTDQIWADQLYNSSDQTTAPKSPLSINILKKMISLRNQSPSIYKNFVCKANSNKPNTQILSYIQGKILIVVRNYPRTNSFASISNFGDIETSLDLTSKFYSGNRMLTIRADDKIYFKEFKIDALDTIVVKLDK